MNLYDHRLRSWCTVRFDLHCGNCIRLAVLVFGISWLFPGGVQAAGDAVLHSPGNDASANSVSAFDLAGDPLPAGAAVRLGTVRFHYEGALASLAVSPNGAVLAGGGSKSATVL